MPATLAMTTTLNLSQQKAVKKLYALEVLIPISATISKP